MRDHSDDVVSSLDDRHRLRRVRDALDHLPAAQRTTVELCLIGEVPQADAGLIGYCIEDPALGPAVRVQAMAPPENRRNNGHVYYGDRVRAVQVPVPDDTLHAEITMADGRVPTPCTLAAGFATCTTGVDETASDPEARWVTVTATTASGGTPVVVWGD